MKLNFLTSKEIQSVREMALDELNSSAKSTSDSPDIHIAKCWIEGFLRVLNRYGYKVTIERDSVCLRLPLQ